MVRLTAEVSVLAAASLSESLQEIGAEYQRSGGGVVRFNFAASNQLARQIDEGAPGDIFFSADEARMDALEKKGLLVDSTRRSRLGNSLVVVVASDSALKLDGIAGLQSEKVRRLVLGEPKSVPAGIYARQYLEKQGLWETLQSKVIPADSVRAALAVIEAGNADAGIVYRTDAMISKKVRIAWEIPRADTPGIRYPVALLKQSKEPDAARRFLKFLESPTADAVFQKHGFLVLH